MISRRPSLILALGAALTVVLAGCGDDSSTAEPVATDAAETAVAVPEGGERTGAVPTSAPSGTSFSFKADDGADEFDFAAYDDDRLLTMSQYNLFPNITMVVFPDLLSVVREFLNPNVSRSGLDRCLRRHGVGSLRYTRGLQGLRAGLPAC